MLTNFYGGGNLGGVQGNVTSNILGTTHVNGSVYGAGYSASVPQVTIYEKSKTVPTINVYTGIITPTPDPDPTSRSTTYTWCYKNNSTNVVVPSGVVIPNTVSTSDPAFEYNGKTISVLDDLETVKANLGTPAEEQPSPFSDNSSDKLYIFGSDPDTIDLATLDGKVQSISVYDYKVKTTKGIGIDSTEEDVIAAYGNSGEKSDSGIETDIMYELGKYSIDFFFKNGKVTAFIYTNNDAQ